MFKKIRTVFCGTPHFAIASLSALVDSQQFEVVGVVSQPDRPSGRGKKIQPSPVKEFALSRGLKVFTPESAKDLTFQQELKDLQATLCVVVAYGQILNKSFLNLFPKRCVNVHGSLLPRWRGAAPMQRALMSGDLETGVSLQLVVPKLDAGDVIAEKKIKLSDEINAIELHDQLSALGGELLKSDLVGFLEGKIVPQKQDESKVTHAAKISNEEAMINWSLSAKDIHNLVRGIAAGPVSTAKLRGKMIKIHKTKWSQTPSAQKPGTVCEINKETFKVSCGALTLEILELQPESKPKMPVKSFLQGYQLKIGECFE